MTARDSASRSRARCADASSTTASARHSAVVREDPFAERCEAGSVLACPGCGGRLRLLATIEEPAVVRKILSHLGIPAECPEALLARAPPRASTSLPELFDLHHD